MYMRASLEIFRVSHSKTAISFNILLVLQILCLRNISNFRCEITSAYNHIQSMQFPFIINSIVLLPKRQYNDKTLTLRNICVCERAERASLETFGILTFLNCYFFQYFVGTSDTLSVQMTCLSA